MDAMIKLQQEMESLLTELIDQEKISANHVRIAGHITESDKVNTTRIRYKCLELVERAYLSGKDLTVITASTKEVLTAN